MRGLLLNKGLLDNSRRHPNRVLHLLDLLVRASASASGGWENRGSGRLAEMLVQNVGDNGEASDLEAVSVKEALDLVLEVVVVGMVA